MSGTMFLLVVLVVIMLGSMPGWPHSRNWGYGPSGWLAMIVAVLLILVLMEKV